jgi:hypothetical protein
MALAMPKEANKEKGFSPCYGETWPQRLFKWNIVSGAPFLRYDQSEYGTPSVAV